ncbi:MAG TPA: hypothetical protein VGE52_02385 [Pirellulales bacterium]
MVSQNLRLYSAESPAPLKIWPALSPLPAVVRPIRSTDPLAARLERAESLLGVDPTAAALVARVVVEQRLRAILADVGGTAMKDSPGYIFPALVELGTFTHAARRVISLAIDAGNAAAHESAPLDEWAARCVLLAARLLLAHESEPGKAPAAVDPLSPQLQGPSRAVRRAEARAARAAERAAKKAAKAEAFAANARIVDAAMQGGAA